MLQPNKRGEYRRSLNKKTSLFGKTSFELGAERAHWRNKNMHQTANQDSLLNVICMELYKEYHKLDKAQPNSSTLVEELFTLRRDTIFLLEAKSALLHHAQKEVVATRNVLRMVLTKPKK